MTAFGVLFTVSLVLMPRQPLAETPKKPTKATEVVIWKYETLLMQEALLTPQGWKTASEWNRSVIRRSVKVSWADAAIS